MNHAQTRPVTGLTFESQRRFLLYGAIISAGLIAGVLIAKWNFYGFFSNQTSGAVTHEIIVSKEKGLTFRSEDGKLLAKLGRDNFGAYLNLLSDAGKPVVTISSQNENGAVVVGNNDGAYIYINALTHGGNVFMVNRYGKQVVEISSGSDTGGTIVLGEGSQGYKVLEFSTSRSGKSARGAINVYGEGEVSTGRIALQRY